jgi:CelD/BcsL family acetyltransferase involved in cellulose biosynthesis
MASVTSAPVPAPLDESGVGSGNKVRSRANTTEKALRYLHPDEYAKWDALVESSPQGSVFCHSWWLKATDPACQVLGYFEGGRLVAGIPLHYEKRFGFELCCMVPPTPRLGVVMEPATGKRVTAAARETELLKIFAQRLAKERIFIQAFHPSLQNWLPFYWSGFRQTSRFTYILEDLQDSNRMWKEMKDSCRRDIHKAMKCGVTISECDPGTVLEVIAKTFARQGKKPPYRADFFQGLCEAAAKNNAGQCFAAVDQSGRVHAAAALVWDRARAYYLVGGGDASLRESGAGYLLLWHMIEFSATRSAIFDFEGSMIQPIEHFFRTFGAAQQMYSYITKFPRWMEASLILSGRL